MFYRFYSNIKVDLFIEKFTISAWKTAPLHFGHPWLGSEGFIMSVLDLFFAFSSSILVKKTKDFIFIGINNTKISTGTTLSSVGPKYFW